MILQQAHELQRRELMSLRAENARLKKQSSGSFPLEEKEKLERHIRHLEQQLKTAERRYNDARSVWKHDSELKRDLEVEMVALQEDNSRLRAEKEELLIRAEKAEKEVLELNGMNKKLEKKVNASFNNSSFPSSAIPFRKKVPNSRKPTGKKPGAQPGHPGHKTKRLQPTKKTIHIPPTEELLNNPDIYPTGKLITKQLVDIQVVVSATDFITEEFRNRVTGSRLHAPFPEGIVNDVNYGASLKGFAFLLNNYYNVPIAKVQQFISDITSGVLSLSTGFVCNLASEFSTATEKERKKIFSLLTHGEILYSDATVSNINGKRNTVILSTNKESVLYQHVEHKGHDGIAQTPVADFKGTIVHDHDKTYYSYGSNHQECIAHILRYLIGASENEPALKWHTKMHKLLQKMIHLMVLHSIPFPAELTPFCRAARAKIS